MLALSSKSLSTGRRESLATIKVAIVPAAEACVLGFEDRVRVARVGFDMLIKLLCVSRNTARDRQGLLPRVGLGTSVVLAL